ncbi:MAG: pyridoxamine 5'-phosphate oxidase family protein [Conexivisphaerales archaeon]
MKPKEFKFLKEHELCRLATASKDGEPHVTPVIYALDNYDIVIATDYGTKKLKNIMENPKVALVVDEFRPNKGLMIQGRCEVLERGEEYLRLLNILFDRFDFYRKNPWKEGEAPILRIRAEKCASWSIE